MKELGMKELLKALCARIRSCDRCGGSGFENPHNLGTCQKCGGQGKTLDATPIISEVTEALETIIQEIQEDA